MKKVFAYILWYASGVVCILACLYGTSASLGVLYHVFGATWAIIGFFVFPITFISMPWYVAFASGHWHLVIVNYPIFWGATWLCMKAYKLKESEI